MALSLNHSSPYGGDDFTYFIVGEVREHRYHGHAEILMYGFLDAVSRQAHTAYIVVPVAIESGQWIKDATIAQIYALVKTTPEFAAATDV